MTKAIMYSQLRHTMSMSGKRKHWVEYLPIPRKLKIRLRWRGANRITPPASPVVVTRINVRQLGLSTGKIVVVRQRKHKIEVRYIP